MRCDGRAGPQDEYPPHPLPHSLALPPRAQDRKMKDFMKKEREKLSMQEHAMPQNI